MSAAATEDSDDELTEAYELLMKGHWCRGESDSDMVKSNDECIVIAGLLRPWDMTALMPNNNMHLWRDWYNCTFDKNTGFAPTV